MKLPADAFCCAAGCNYNLNPSFLKELGIGEWACLCFRAALNGALACDGANGGPPQLGPALPGKRCGFVNERCGPAGRAGQQAILCAAAGWQLSRRSAVAAGQHSIAARTPAKQLLADANSLNLLQPTQALATCIQLAPPQSTPKAYNMSCFLSFTQALATCTTTASWDATRASAPHPTLSSVGDSPVSLVLLATSQQPTGCRCPRSVSGLHTELLPTLR